MFFEMSFVNNLKNLNYIFNNGLHDVLLNVSVIRC
mgnify:CR=1 FL=1